jgi:hypothetical protein
MRLLNPEEVKSCAGVGLIMTSMRSETPGHGIAVFPFLKTSGAIQLGDFTVRSTDDTEGLTREDARSAAGISGIIVPGAAVCAVQASDDFDHSIIQAGES